MSTSIPKLSIGTYRLKGEECTRIIIDAIHIGYRSLDTASVYKNEPEIGRALQHIFKTSLVQRNDLFIQTKIGPGDQGYLETIASVERSLLGLGVSCMITSSSIEFLFSHHSQSKDLDSVLIHWPGTKGIQPQSMQNKANRHASFKALIELQSRNIIKHIGVSNYTKFHLKELYDEFRVFPRVNQIEFHPLYHHNDIVEYCFEHDITVQAYASFGEGEFFVEGSVLQSCLKVCDKKVNKDKQVTLAQVLLKWADIKGVSLIPKASSFARLKENFDYLKVEMDEMDVNEIDKEEERLGKKKFCWDPEFIL